MRVGIAAQTMSHTVAGMVCNNVSNKRLSTDGLATAEMVGMTNRTFGSVNGSAAAPQKAGGLNYQPALPSPALTHFHFAAASTQCQPASTAPDSQPLAGRRNPHSTAPLPACRYVTLRAAGSPAVPVRHWGDSSHHTQLHCVPRNFNNEEDNSLGRDAFRKISLGFGISNHNKKLFQ